MFGWCAVPGITTFFAPAIPFSRVSAIFRIASASWPPTMMSVGTCISESRPAAGGSISCGCTSSSSPRSKLRVVIARTRSRTRGSTCSGVRYGPSVHNWSEISTERAISPRLNASSIAANFALSSSSGSPYSKPLNPAPTVISASTISGYCSVKSTESAPPIDRPSTYVF